MQTWGSAAQKAQQHITYRCVWIFRWIKTFVSKQCYLNDCLNDLITLSCCRVLSENHYRIFQGNASTVYRQGRQLLRPNFLRMLRKCGCVLPVGITCTAFDRVIREKMADVFWDPVYFLQLYCEFEWMWWTLCWRPDCGAVCHPPCLSSLPANCGLMSDYARLTVDVRCGTSSGGKMSAAKKSTSALQLATYMKLPRFPATQNSSLSSSTKFE